MMDRADTAFSFARLLEVLAASPMWQWGSAPVLWAVINEEDPVVMVPAFAIEDVTVLQMMAAHWMAEHPGNVPVSTLALVIEDNPEDGLGHRQEVRDCIVTKKDGTMLMVRNFMSSGALVRLDPMTVESYPVEVMREVGASAWP